ncbi:hypothetical protein [Zhihengliuella salsuginis]|uniref:Flp pilus-assembly TadE/G-like n=1 Tax=Zhihengliuella salsuginis TaxID=578222 RepID=A0ABQ3GIF3_9MICC|nr:hypothetical protein [Zhihengliuella salsuginis]GHD08798.1 hypothetical protein GCM10008096_20840 [Zhihengliuella salsuginis]
MAHPRRQAGAGLRGHVEDETGQSMILIIGYVVIALLAISAMLAATSVNLEARRLQSVADGVADAAANGAALGGGAVRLSDSSVRARSETHLGRTNASARFQALNLAGARASADGGTAYVVLEAQVDPPIVGWFVPSGIPIRVEADARSAMNQ